MNSRTISRRSILKGAGLAAAAAALGPVFAPIAANAAALTDADLEALRQRWIDQLTGRTAMAGGDPRFAAAIARLDRAAQGVRALFAAGVGTRTRVFTDADLGVDAQIVTTYKRLAQLATAWATPGSALEGDDVVLREILDGLADGHRLVYNAGQQEFGNWWSWEIGTPKSLTDTLAIVRDHVDPQLLADCCAAVDHFIPDPTMQFPDSRGKQPSDGANRVDICQGIIIRSIVGGDVPRLKAAIAALTPTWQYVTRGNGFFADGSFIQHSTIGYTGTYGVVLLGGLAKLFSLLGPSTYAVADPSRSILFDSVERSFAPFVHDGLVMDSVRGRAISRAQERGYDDGAITMEAVLWLARGVDAATAARWRSLCLGWLRRNTVTDPVADASIPRLALFTDLEATTTTPAPEPAGHAYFPAMDRSVYRGEGWAAALGLCSRRTTWYECGNGENETGYHTGSGLTYLYAADAGHWDDDFWPTANLSRLPGITVDTTPLPRKVEGEWGARTPANEWTGGATRDEFGMAAQHLVGPGGTGLSARKAWFFVPGMAIALGADIRTASGARVESVVEHRNLGAAGGRAVTVDGAPLASADQSTARGSRWAHIDGVGGYLFLGSEGVGVLRERRTGAWKDINKGGPADRITREYATFVVDHGVAPTQAAPGSYAYAVLPGRTAAATRNAAEGRGPVPEVLRNDALAQGIRYDKLTAAAFWAPAQVGRVAAEGPAVVLCWESPGIVKLGVADPTQAADSVVLRLSGTGATRARSKAAVTFRTVGDALEVTVPTRGLAGVTVEVDLLP